MLQLVLFLAVVGAAWWGTTWPSQARIATRVAGMAAIVVGVSLSLAGSRALRSALTPFPRPRDDTAFRSYRSRVRRSFLPFLW